MKSHITFASDCQLASIEELTKKTTGESYWKLKDHRDVVYLIYKQSARIAHFITAYLQDVESDKLSPPVRLEGYVSHNRGLFLCVLRCLLYDSASKTYYVAPDLRTADNPSDVAELTTPETILPAP